MNACREMVASFSTRETNRSSQANCSWSQLMAHLVPATAAERISDSNANEEKVRKRNYDPDCNITRLRWPVHYLPSPTVFQRIREMCFPRRAFGDTRLKLKIIAGMKVSPLGKVLVHLRHTFLKFICLSSEGQYFIFPFKSKGSFLSIVV